MGLPQVVYVVPYTNTTNTTNTNAADNNSSTDTDDVAGYVFLLGSLLIFSMVYFFLASRSLGSSPVATTASHATTSHATASPSPVAVQRQVRSEAAVAHMSGSTSLMSLIPFGVAPLKSLGEDEVPEVTLSEDVGPSEAITFGDVVPSADGSGAKTVQVSKEGSGPGGEDKVVKQRSDLDGEYYFVAASLPDRKKAADKLAEIHRRSQYLLQAIDEQLDGSRRIKAGDGTDITDNMRKLVRRHYQKTVPFAEYHNPSDQTVGSNSDKGMLIQICLRSKQDPSQWNSDNTLFRVHVHELAHSADHHFREDGNAGHGPEFYRLMNYLLEVAENLGIYSCEEYKRSGRAFCGLALTEEDTHCG